jgi:NAD(P)-dependent dehydrogenase (short-subunit alcohol dehydrogenase family)
MILDKFSLKGKIGLVTGAGSGIGKEIAIGLAEAGGKLALAGRNTGKLEKAAAEMSSHGIDAVPFYVDMANQDSISDLVESVLEEYCRIDFLFNNAGTIHRAPFEEFPIEKWEEAIKVNLTGPFLLSQAIARHMIEKNIKGSIVNISSIIAIIGGVNIPAYAATKAGLTQLTRSMSNDLAKFGIRVNAIGPGWVKTELTERLQNDDERFNAITARIPLGRWAVPEEMAGLAVFLASEASGYITGQTIFIDGGYLAM